MKQNKVPHTIEVKIKKGQRLSEVKQLFPLPSDAIFHKRLPGIGATYGEIIAPRNSIIVLPNRPVIEMKVAKHNTTNPPENQILGIYKGISLQDVMDYLANDTIKYKKILTTPEGYQYKLKEVVGDVFDYIKKEYYLLIDECERTIQDVDYRSKITAPFDDFFDFTNKGLISATTLPFSDPRFADIAHYVIKPVYSYVKPLTLITTNNIVSAFREITALPTEVPYFIFLSSIRAITALIEATGIKEESKIHCSENRIQGLKMKGFKADHRLNTKKLAKYNFFTSRFYSAVDITLDCKPKVIMLTEVIFAEHSILDPQTELIQIAGRFRNGVDSLAHVTNFNQSINVRTTEQIKNYLDGQQEVYKEILLLKDKLKTEGAQEAIKQILTESKFASYFKPDGSYNWFMFDNMIQEERVLGLYQTRALLITGYDLVKDHFKLTLQDKQYLLSDMDRLKRQSAKNRVEELKGVVNELSRLDQRIDNLVIGREQAYNELIAEYPEIVEAYRIIGGEEIVRVNYNEARVRALVKKAKDMAQFFTEAMLKAVYTKFGPDTTHKTLYVITTLKDIYDRNNIVCKVYGTHILLYFEGRETTQKTSDNKVYVLGKAKFNYCTNK